MSRPETITYKDIFFINNYTQATVVCNSSFGTFSNICPIKPLNKNHSNLSNKCSINLDLKEDKLIPTASSREYSFFPKENLQSPWPEFTKVVISDQVAHNKKLYDELVEDAYNDLPRFKNYISKKLPSEISNAFATTISHIFTSTASDIVSAPYRYLCKKMFSDQTRGIEYFIKNVGSAFLGSFGFFLGKSILNVGLEKMMKSEFMGCYDKPEEAGMLKSIACNKMTYFLLIDTAIIGFEVYTGGFAKFGQVASGKLQGYLLSNFIIDGLETYNLIEPEPLSKELYSEFLRDGITATRLLSKQQSEFGSWALTGDKSFFKNNHPGFHKTYATISFDVGLEYIIRSKDVEEAKHKVNQMILLNIAASAIIFKLSPIMIITDVVNFLTNSAIFDLNTKITDLSGVKYVSSKKEFTSLIEIFSKKFIPDTNTTIPEESYQTIGMINDYSTSQE